MKDRTLVLWEFLHSVFGLASGDIVSSETIHQVLCSLLAPSRRKVQEAGTRRGWTQEKPEPVCVCRGGEGIVK